MHTQEPKFYTPPCRSQMLKWCGTSLGLFSSQVAYMVPAMPVKVPIKVTGQHITFTLRRLRGKTAFTQNTHKEMGSTRRREKLGKSR